MKFSGQWLLHKNKPFDEVYRSVVGKKAAMSKKD